MALAPLGSAWWTQWHPLDALTLDTLGTTTCQCWLLMNVIHYFVVAHERIACFLVSPNSPGMWGITGSSAACYVEAVGLPEPSKPCAQVACTLARAAASGGRAKRAVLPVLDAGEPCLRRGAASAQPVAAPAQLRAGALHLPCLQGLAGFPRQWTLCAHAHVRHTVHNLRLHQSA